jgi:hypothetical protein
MPLHYEEIRSWAAQLWAETLQQPLAARADLKPTVTCMHAWMDAYYLSAHLRRRAVAAAMCYDALSGDALAGLIVNLWWRRAQVTRLDDDDDDALFAALHWMRGQGLLYLSDGMVGASQPHLPCRPISHTDIHTYIHTYITGAGGDDGFY